MVNFYMPISYEKNYVSNRLKAVDNQYPIVMLHLQYIEANHQQICSSTYPKAKNKTFLVWAFRETADETSRHLTI